jgi:MED6 mediator sub complex component
MSETASFVDPVFLARFGLSRVNVIDYFLHPLNPFRTHANTSNEVLAMQGISIGMFIQAGTNGIPLPPQAAEEEYEKALARIPGEQYQLLPPEDPVFYVQPSPLYTIRYVNRTSPNSIKILGVYYVVEGVIYKSPAIRSLLKSNVARTLDGLSGACSALSVCARYLPSTGYTWNFEDSDDGVDPVALMKLNKRMKRRKILDHRKVGERSEAEEEGLRASAAIDQILVRLSKSPYVASAPPSHRTETIAVAEPPPSANSSTTGILSSPASRS